MKPLIDKGYIYIAKPPLFKVSRRKKERYIDTEDQLDKYLIELGCDDVQIKRLPGKELDSASLQEAMDLFTSAQQISQGLERHGIEPSSYLKFEKDGKFPIARITVREPDGTRSETFAYNDIEEAEIIEKAEARLAPLENTAENAEEITQSTEDGPSIVRDLHPAIDLINIHESKACEDLAARMKEYDLSIDNLYGGEDALFEITVDESDSKQVNSLYSLFEEIKKTGRQGLQIQRYKGLGEMNAEQLWETTMDPENRKMIQVTMEDAFEAERIFTLLMGDDVDPRREYIEKHAATVKDLDI
jgi:DNA gyrase subunit B